MKKNLSSKKFFEPEIIPNELFFHEKPYFLCISCRAIVPVDNYFIVKSRGKRTLYLHKGTCPECLTVVNGPFTRSINYVPMQGVPIKIKNMKKKPEVISYEDYKRENENNNLKRGK